MHAFREVQLSFDLDAPPDGLVYLPSFVDADEERALLAAVTQLDYQAVVMHGQAAKRKVVHFGVTYGYASWSLDEAAPLPGWAQPLVPRIAAAMHERAEAISQLLALPIAARSLYVLGGAARHEWQHMIPPARADRWSLTFRTLKPGARPTRVALRRAGAATG